MEDPKKPTAVKMPEVAKKVEHKNIQAALSAFQGELRTMPKSATVDFPTQKGNVKFSYTPLGEIMTYIYPLLAKHGLAVRHEISEGGVEAILTHETYAVEADLVSALDGGQTLSSEKNFLRRVDNELRSGVVKLKGGEKMQDTGAAITYARRYTLTMLLGISSEDDKDAELLEASAKNAQNYAEGKAKQAIDAAKTVAEVEKAVGVLRKDLELVNKGKPGALGLTKEVYEGLLLAADAKVHDLETN